MERQHQDLRKGNLKVIHRLFSMYEYKCKFFKTNIKKAAAYWISLGNATNNGAGVGGSDIVYALAMNGTNTLFVAGSFSSVDGGLISVNNIP